MELNDLRSIMTVVSLVTFLAIVWWAFSRGSQKNFEEAANLPFMDDDQRGEAPESAERR